MELAVGVSVRGGEVRRRLDLCLWEVGEVGSGVKSSPEDSSRSTCLLDLGLDFAARFLDAGFAAGAGAAFSLPLPLPFAAGSGIGLGEAMVISRAMLMSRLRAGAGEADPILGRTCRLLGPPLMSESEGMLVCPCLKSFPALFFFPWHGKQMAQEHPRHFNMLSVTLYLSQTVHFAVCIVCGTHSAGSKVQRK